MEKGTWHWVEEANEFMWFPEGDNTSTAADTPERSAPDQAVEGGKEAVVEPSMVIEDNISQSDETDNKETGKATNSSKHRRDHRSTSQDDWFPDWYLIERAQAALNYGER